MKTLVIALVAILSSMNILGQSINIHTKIGTDTYKLNQIDSSIVYNRQVFKSHDSIGVTVIFPVGSLYLNQNVNCTISQNSETQSIFDEIAEQYKVIVKDKFEYRINVGNKNIIDSNFTVIFKINQYLNDNLNSNLVPCTFVEYLNLNENESNIQFVPCVSEYQGNQVVTSISNNLFNNLLSQDGGYELVFIIGLVVKNSTNKGIVKLVKHEEILVNENEKIGSPFGKDKMFPITQGLHLNYGVDYGCINGTNLYAVKRGVVTEARLFPANTCYLTKACHDVKGGWGNKVTIKHDDGSISIYGHLSEFAVKENDQVEMGSLLGKSGGICGLPSSGCSSGPHLHYSYIPVGKKSAYPPDYIDKSKSDQNTITDQNDNVYKIALMPDGRYWMIENLKRGSYIESDKSDEQLKENKKIDMFGYQDNSANCLKYGGMYTWNEAMYYSEKAQGICPNEWHIPTKTEWETLTNLLKKNFNSIFKPQFSGYMQRDPNIQFGYLDQSANYWTSTPEGDGKAFQVRFNSSTNPYSAGQIIGPYSKSIKDAVCIRCIKDQVISKESKISAINKASVGIPFQQLELIGENFAPIPTIEPIIYYNYEPLKPIYYDDQKVVFEIPETSNYGNMISIKNSLGSESNSMYLRVDENGTKPYPFVHFLTPASTYEGEAVTISGNSFGEYNASNSQLFLGDNKINVNPTDWTETSIKFTVPAGASSSNLTVKVEDRSSKPIYFEVTEKPASTPYIYYIEPQMALVGDTVEINGLNFGSTVGNNTITFNGTNATINPTAWSDKKIQLVVPTGATSGNVVVKVNQDLSNNMYFVVLPPAPKPVIKSIAPTHFQVGENVTINGNYFGYNPNGSDYVEMNALKVDNSNITDWNNSQITLKVPQGVTSGKLFITANKLKSDGIDFAIDVPDTSSTGTVTDQNGNIYKTKIFGTQEWMIENLRRGQGISSETAQMNNSIVEKYAYNDVTSNDSLGGLYLWDEAMNWSTDPSGICPLGWHIPSDTEWNTLINFIGTNPGTKLMDGGISGFNAKITGSWFASFWGAKTETYFWTSTPTSISNAISRSLQIGDTSVGLNDDDKQNGYCIRCMKNK